MQIHSSTFHIQRYKLILVCWNVYASRLDLSKIFTKQYSKCLGNDRPQIIVDIEKVIWEQLILIARGFQTVHQAADTIIGTFPATFDDVDPAIGRWFIVGMKINNICIIHY